MKKRNPFVKDADCFYKVCTEVLNQHAPHKKKYVRGNNKRFMNRALSKAIMQRTKLRNKFLKDRQQKINFPTASKEIGVFHYYQKKRKNILPI